MIKHLLNRLRGSGAQALAAAALLLTSAAGHAQTTAYCATGLGGVCGGNNITAFTILSTTLNATGLTCTAVGAQAYTDYPATGNSTGTLSAGSTYTLSTTLSGASIVSVWVDFDHNFVFDASEWTQVATSSAIGTPVSVAIAVPTTAVQGPTAIRVRSRATGSPNGAGDACTSFFSGETKDFAIAIGAPATCPLVSGVSITNQTATGAQVNFTPTASASTYTLTLTPPSGPATTQTATASPVALTGLTASTTYTVSIVSNCGAANGSSAAYTVPFTTACLAAPYAPVNNTTAYTQDFEATWLSLCGTKEAPATNWRNTPLSGNASWRREDDGPSATWTSNSGAYTPAGSPLDGGTASLHSARFHSYDIPGRGTGQLDLFVSMAGTAGTPTLSFDYLNTSGTDSLKVYLSTNGGSTFGPVLLGLRNATAWTRQTLALPATGLTATTIVRLRAVGDFGVTDIGLDNVRVSYISCPPVTAASVTGITATGATLNFTPGAGSASYTVTVTPAGGTATTITPAPTAAPVTLTGLTASTTYTVSIVSNCGGGNGSSTPTTLTFNSACLAAPYAPVNNTTAYTQDFEATWLSLCGTKEAPATNWRNTPLSGNASWRREDDGPSATWTSNSGAYTPAGSPLDGGTASLHSARFHSYDIPGRGTGQLDLFVSMAGTAGTPTLSFDYLNTSGTDSLKVYLSTNGGSTFGPVLLGLRNATAWTRQTLALPATGLTATTIVRLRAVGDFGVTDIGLDNVRVSYISCPPVTGISFSNITTTGATLDFTPAPGGASYTVTVTPAGGTATPQTVTASPVALTGLTASTAYTVSIVTSCGATNGSSVAATATFRTDCAAAPYVLVNNTAPYTQNFEATWLSQCGTNEIPDLNWRGKPLTGNNAWRREDDGASAAWTSNSGAYTPAGSPLGSPSLHSARFHSYNATQGSSGQLDLFVSMAGTTGTPTLSFDYLNTNGSDSLKVYLSTNGGSTFRPAALVGLRNATAWTRQTVALPATGLTATTVVRLLAISDFGGTDIGVDNLRLDYITCPAVTAATVASITATGATLSFTPAPGSGSYLLTVTPATGPATTQTATASPVALTGLTASTAYTVSIVSNCGTTNGSSAPTFVSFTTECTAAPYVLVNNTTPYTQDFEATWLSQCGTREIPDLNWRGKPLTGNNAWRREDDGASAAWTSLPSGAYTPTGSTNNGTTGSHSARFHSYSATRGSSGQLDLFVNLAGSGAAAGLTFDYLNTSGTDSLTVLVSTNGGSTFGRSLLKLTTATAWTRQTVTLPATASATTVVRFLATSDFGATDIGLDNVRVTYSACLPVAGLTATNVTSTGAQLAFTPPAGAPTGTTYEVEYGLQGFALGAGTKVTGLTAPTHTLTSLTQSQTYCFYVRQNCGTANGSSSYAGPMCFSTPLPVPTNDDPCGAVALGSAPTTGSTVGASTSAQNGISLPTCSGAQLPKDVWFSFTPTTTTLPLTITGTAAGTVRVFSSPSCSAGPFALVFCQAAPGNNQNVGAVTVTGLTPGTRYYLAVSGYGSADVAGSFTIGGVATATRAQADTDALLVYPNPSSTGQLTLRLSGLSGTGQATLLNALGQVVAIKTLSGTPEQTLRTRGLATGLYTLRVAVAGRVLTRKVVLE